MRDLYVAVVEQLKSQRDSNAALTLWEEFWEAYEVGGAEGIEAVMEDLAEYPKSAEE